MENKHNNRFTISPYLSIGAAVISIILGTLIGVIVSFENQYKSRIYPSVYIGNTLVGKKTQNEVENYLLSKGKPYAAAKLTLTFESHVATISGTDINLTIDAPLSATQAYMVGRSKYLFSNIRERYSAQPIVLTPAFTWNTQALEASISALQQIIDIPMENALFEFQSGKVTSFRPSQTGRSVEIKQLMDQINNAFLSFSENNYTKQITIPIKTVSPDVTTEKANSLGIKERISTGYSEYPGSIPGRIYNVALAASKLHGVLIPPGETFSFNKTIGDISAATGYQSAYIIKDGRTVMGDGGGVCQVSTTLFRAALYAGLPIVERHEHSYRVHYYEDDGSKAGLDATVFHPTEDLKFTNDTPGYILIQTKTDTKNLTLAFDFYGTTDGRKAEILNHVVGGVVPPPAPLYQDDPTLAKGIVRQVDFAAWGAKASFLYRVTKNNQTPVDTTFVSNYRPWQAVYLRGTKE